MRTNPTLGGIVAGLCIAALAAPAAAQVSWPPQFETDPACIHPQSSASLLFSGTWPDSGKPTSAHVIINNNEIDVIFQATVGVLPVLTPWSLPAGIGRLPAGTYSVYTTAADQIHTIRPRTFAGTFVVDPECPLTCYANCDGSITPPILNVDDFTCFINEFAAAQSLPHAQQVTHYANCDGSVVAPVLNVDDFTCFINAFAAGCP